ncbi:MAG TPA: SRPBCC family protein [Segetibacter sp.]|jgi:hypothetical protein
MRFLKLGIISFIVFGLLITGISLLLPSSVIISRAIDISASPAIVYTHINNLSKWKNWYAGYDSSNASVTATAAGKGASLTTGSTVITIENTSPSQINTVWKTGKSSILPSQFNFIVQRNSSHFTLQWQFIQKVKWYPWEKFASIVSDKAMGPILEESLENLKNLAEETPANTN